jgi:putative transposase
MARKPRFTLPGVPQHIIQRGHNREPCFYALEDYMRYRSDLQEAAEVNQVAIHAYVFMTNHVHLLVTPGHAHSITHMMQDIGRKYVRYINHSYQRTGSLWAGRFKASLVDSEVYLMTCMRYIEMNPVRANMVRHPSEYVWSSYAANAQGQFDKLITPHPLYIQLGGDPEQRLLAYRKLFNQLMGKTEIHAIRTALNQELVLGREEFKDKIEKMLKRQVRPGIPGRPRIEELSASYYVY